MPTGTPRSVLSTAGYMKNAATAGLLPSRGNNAAVAANSDDGRGHQLRDTSKPVDDRAISTKRPLGVRRAAVSSARRRAAASESLATM